MNTINQYMSKKLASVESEDLVLNAISLMKSRQIGSVLVYDEDKKLAGIFTERDVLTKIDIRKGEELGTLRIKDIMTKDLKTVDPDESYIEVIKVMQANNIRHMPVVKGKKVVGMVSLRDLTKRYEEDLKSMLEESFKQLRDIKFALDQHAIVSVIDPEGRIVYANDKFCDISRYHREELLGQDYRMFFEKDYSRKFRENLETKVKGGKVWQGEVKYRAKDGSSFWVHSTVVPFLNKLGKPYQFVAIRTDISQRKLYEEKLESANRDLAEKEKELRKTCAQLAQANKELLEAHKQLIHAEKMASIGTLAAGIAHEIKNPLAIIMQGNERIEKLLLQQNDQKNAVFATMIKDAAQRANRIVTSLLRFSQSSHSEIKPLNIFDVLNAALELVKEHCQEHQIKTAKKYCKKELSIYGDKIMLQQAFFDLFTNAIDAMPGGGKLSVKVSFKPEKDKTKEKGKYIIEVTDTGEGIAEEHLKNIFDPFFTTKDEGKGTGLGLSTVFLILEDIKGAIAVKSKRGVGTTFTITLPVLPEPPMPEEIERIMKSGG